MRVAVYFTPPATHQLVRAAAEWLGRDAITGERLRQRSDGGMSAEEVDAITAEPRRYGFHATLKAPFRLASAIGMADVEAAARAFAAAFASFPAPRLAVRPVGAFLALTPEFDSLALRHLADEAVRAFEPFRAPMDETEIARRLAAGLSELQRRYLVDWGYPYVFDEFQFHMTLTSSLEPGVRGRALEVLRRRFREPLSEPLSIDAIALFTEAEPGADFQVHGRYPFAAAEGRA